MSYKIPVEIENASAEEKYSGLTLANSRLFAPVKWAALVVLEPDKYYTIPEAWALVLAFLNRKVG